MSLFPSMRKKIHAVEHDHEHEEEVHGAAGGAGQAVDQDSAQEADHLTGLLEDFFLIGGDFVVVG